MKSERELLRENLERFRVARPHHTEDPAKRQRKFQKLNEEFEEDFPQIYTMSGVTESGPGGQYVRFDRFKVMLQNPDFSKDGDDFICSLTYKPVDIENANWTDDWSDYFEEFTPLEIFDESGRKVWENNDPYFSDYKNGEKY